MAGIGALLPTTAPDGVGAPSGRVFKIERGAAGEKITYVRMFSGSLGVRTRLDLPQGRSGKVSGLQLFEHGRWVRTDALAGGQIGRLTGLSRPASATGSVTAWSRNRTSPPPSLEASVAAVRPEQGPDLRAALAELSDADPLIAARSDDDGLAVVSLYGRVQQEVIATTLDEDYGIEVEFADASVLHVERPRPSGRRWSASTPSRIRTTRRSV